MAVQSLDQAVNYCKRFGPRLVATKMLYKLLPQAGFSVCRQIEEYLKHYYLPDVAYHKTEFCGKIQADAPIWVMWWQGEEQMPDVVRLAVASMRRFAGRRPVILITKDNYRDYVERSADFYRYVECGAISLTHFSDYVRFDLLHKYGGFWLDATLLMTAPIPDFVNDLRLFSIKHGTIRPGEQWSPMWSRNWTAYCWGGCAGDPFFDFMLRFFERYHEREDGVMIDYFLMDRIISVAYQEFVDVRNTIDAIPVNNVDVLTSPIVNTASINHRSDDNGTFLHKLSWKEPPQPDCGNGQRSWFGQLLDQYGIR